MANIISLKRMFGETIPLALNENERKISTWGNICGVHTSTKKRYEGNFVCGNKKCKTARVPNYELKNTL